LHSPSQRDSQRRADMNRHRVRQSATTRNSPRQKVSSIAKVVIMTASFESSTSVHLLSCTGPSEWTFGENDHPCTPPAAKICCTTAELYPEDDPSGPALQPHVATLQARTPTACLAADAVRGSLRLGDIDDVSRHCGDESIMVWLSQRSSLTEEDQRFMVCGEYLT
jgi:hypothetical protein